MGWPKGKSRKPIEEEEEKEGEEMKKATPLGKKAKTGELSSDAVIFNTKLETYLETYTEQHEHQCMDSEITGHLEDKIGKEKNADTVSELHGHLEGVLEARNDKVIVLNKELDEISQSTTITSAQEQILLSMDRMDLKAIQQFDGFLQLCLKKSEFVHLTSTVIHREYIQQELIYTALCDFAENNTKDAYKANNNYRVRMAPRASSSIMRSSSSSGGNDTQETTA